MIINIIVLLKIKFSFHTKKRSVKIKALAAKMYHVSSGWKVFNWVLQIISPISHIKSHLPQWASNEHNKCKMICWVRLTIYHYLVSNCPNYFLFKGGVEWAFRMLYTKYLRNLKILVNLMFLQFWSLKCILRPCFSHIKFNSYRKGMNLIVNGLVLGLIHTVL